jgi:hypothetical protein
MRDWRPHIDLARLSAALEQEILAATDDELRAAAAPSDHVLTGAAQEIRELIDALSGESRPELDLLLAECVAFRASIARQH